MADIVHEQVKQAMSRIRRLSADEEAKRLAFVRERALRDEVSLLNEARQEGLQEGELRLLQRLLGKRFGVLPPWAMERLESASLEQLERWSDEILSAQTLEKALVWQDDQPGHGF